MSKIFWFSRHELTNGQIVTLKEHLERYNFGTVVIEQRNLIFDDDIVNQVKEFTDQKIIALVAPLSYGLILLRAGYTIIEFVNIPSARQKGVFLCKGMNIHTLQTTEFIACPVPIEEQEESSLNY